MKISDFLEFGEVDKKLWIGIAGVSAVVIILLSVFATTSPFYWVERFVITILEMFVPGYLITKLFFDKVAFSEYPVADKFIVSLTLSIATVQTLYFLSTYVRTYGLNVDEDVISSDKIAVALVLLVIAGAFGIKYYLLRKKTSTPAS
ncbi:MULTISPECIES: hypothetical protein [Methylococcus]|jgi:uncharacterized membrane protein|uniref:Uncharacterized protein n=1 Tax=Methylococcus capsulatus TaxID=414 RepID=A0AA35V2R5_METCP|nr:hypothetical protein [Methylococcus capsulatus]QXP87768.1 hypothetical protein KW112_01000 [Methylococcus capsulatus]QXP90880.1 hypothetical protein KW114_01565 [Methylococcus capsulatus]QXP92494.1 hypothetical protein KW113_08785 [Methylococcus capsulatus]UQN12782.1 hypothetical protein M3M30_02705 [Methylococcus capsulatus]CAI8880882.1 conserved membrane protein of unknown function [Methylococcus capsulatus]